MASLYEKLLDKRPLVLANFRQWRPTLSKVRKTRRSYPSPGLQPGESFQVTEKGRRVQEEPARVLELGGLGWVSGNAKTAGACREEYQKGESCTEGDLQKFAEGPSRVGEYQQYELRRCEETNSGWGRTVNKIQRNSAQRFHGTKNKAFSHQLEWQTPSSTGHQVKYWCHKGWWMKTNSRINTCWPHIEKG